MLMLVGTKGLVEAVPFERVWFVVAGAGWPGKLPVGGGMGRQKPSSFSPRRIVVIPLHHFASG